MIQLVMTRTECDVADSISNATITVIGVHVGIAAAALLFPQASVVQLIVMLGSTAVFLAQGFHPTRIGYYLLYDPDGYIFFLDPARVACLSYEKLKSVFVNHTIVTKAVRGGNLSDALRGETPDIVKVGSAFVNRIDGRRVGTVSVKKCETFVDVLLAHMYPVEHVRILDSMNKKIVLLVIYWVSNVAYLMKVSLHATEGDVVSAQHRFDNSNIFLFLAYSACSLLVIMWAADVGNKVLFSDGRTFLFIRTKRAVCYLRKEELIRADKREGNLILTTDHGMCTIPHDRDLCQKVWTVCEAWGKT